MKQFINARDTLVTEAIDGLLRTAGGRLARLDGYPHIKVVARTDWNRSKVALISGGRVGARAVACRPRRPRHADRGDLR